ncbi:hypothetical protein ACFL2K_00645, partial [Candidatus Margulisiibacteriota bacterium]
MQMLGQIFKPCSIKENINLENHHINIAKTYLNKLHWGNPTQKLDKNFLLQPKDPFKDKNCFRYHLFISKNLNEILLKINKRTITSLNCNDFIILILLQSGKIKFNNFQNK